MPIGRLETEADVDRKVREILREHGQVRAESLIGQVGLTGLPDSVAGDGLSGGNGSPLSVNVDDSTIEIVGDTLQAISGGAARVYKSSDQTHSSSGSYIKVTFDSASFDTDSIFDDANDRLIAPIAGIYHVTGQVQFANNAGSNFIAVLKNGSTLNQVGGHAADASGGASWQVSDYVSMAATDYVELWAYQNTGGSVVLQAASNVGCRFAMAYWGAV